MYLTTEDRISNLENEIRLIRENISNLQSDINDFKEAFEHADDSLQRVRTSVAVLTGDRG